MSQHRWFASLVGIYLICGFVIFMGSEKRPFLQSPWKLAFPVILNGITRKKTLLEIKCWLPSGSSWHEGEQLKWQLSHLPLPLIGQSGYLLCGSPLLCKSTGTGRATWRAAIPANHGWGLGAGAPWPISQWVGGGLLQKDCENDARRCERPVIFPLPLFVLSRSLFIDA